jgi:antitoxin component of MazEF toxin-antitoxin module/energy-coupling factor transporter ATP-binding protein EcfA2
MRMVALRLQGYRRFERETTLDLTPRVVAVVGPNEAGKSSLLDAMENIGDPSSDREFQAGEFTGRDRPDDGMEILSALFEVESDDREALAHIPGADAIRLWHRQRMADGQAYGEVIPRLERPQLTRLHVRAELQRMLASRSKAIERYLEQEQPRHSEEAAEDAEESPTVREVANAALAGLDEPKETLSGSAQSNLHSLAEALSDPPANLPKYVKDLSGSCRKLAAEHAEEHPSDLAWEILNSRCPAVRVLRDNDRELRSSYPFEEYDEAPAPLENLLSLAGIGWQAIKQAAAEPSNPTLANLLGRGNRELEKRLHGSWKQATVSVELREQAGALNIFPYDAESDTHSRIEDRSDGFRSFLAMLAFTTRHSAGKRKLILAIDEAERHLHYNAQADLVNVLTRQTFATQIIYTTHSAGCLPEDLGSAIRVVKPIPGDRSAVKNGFWSAQEKEKTSGGFTSLLMAMGADAVAFTPARFAVITEGPSDALLLPALIRAALNLPIDEPLGLQVAGGLAWTPPRRLSELEAEAAHVVYLTDSDEEGEKYAADLKDAGVDPKRIFVLPSSQSSGLSIEDFVHKGTLVEVVNFLLQKLREHDGEALRETDVPNVGAATAIETWQKDQKIEPISKTAIAEHVLRVCRANLAYVYWDPGEGKALPLLRENRRLAMTRLHSRLRTALGIKDPEED